VKLSRDAAVHAGLALLMAILVSAMLWGLRALGLDPLPAAGALAGTGFFVGRELGQAPLKRSGTINHKEWAWPAIACGIAAAIGTAVIAAL
jgi:hypothetical protein